MFLKSVTINKGLVSTRNVLRQLKFNLILYEPCIILQYICDPTDTQRFMIKFIHNTWWLDIFRNSVVHLQERFIQAVYVDLVCDILRAIRYVQILCGCR